MSCVLDDRLPSIDYHDTWKYQDRKDPRSRMKKVSSTRRWSLEKNVNIGAFSTRINLVGYLTGRKKNVVILVEKRERCNIPAMREGLKSGSKFRSNSIYNASLNSIQQRKRFRGGTIPNMTTVAIPYTAEWEIYIVVIYWRALSSSFSNSIDIIIPLNIFRKKWGHEDES